MKRLAIFVLLTLCSSGALFAGDSEDYSALYVQAGATYGIDPDIVQAVAEIESAHNPYAVSSSGARGLMQLMPRTAAWHCKIYGYELHDARKNVFCGVSYLAYLNRKMKGSLPLVLASYYTGPGTVQRNGYRPPKRAYAYIAKFQAAYNRIKAKRGHQRDMCLALLSEGTRLAALAKVAGTPIPGL
ncbi:MAG: transglycosylase SLT domain-containing protein [Leptospiraceae bacterium]|nr:transglycosylase SLT domain-containing protein [Leptospiraceae bacterium]